jgi:membrane-bound inhibitor of C-type lysozyme
MFSHRLTKIVAVGALVVAIGGGSYGIVSATNSSNSAAASPALSTAGSGVRSGVQAGPRSGPAAGGAVGAVASVSPSGFTITTAAGQQVTITTASSTEYLKGTSALAASAVKKGQTVLVLGTVNNKAITASQVLGQTSSGATVSSAVVPFQRGAPSTAKQVGQVPASYSQGSGTIVSGKTANKATAAALAVYPGGIVDRVVKLSNGEYEVHNIGVNWPHHIFVNQSFKVVGAG